MIKKAMHLKDGDVWKRVRQLTSGKYHLNMYWSILNMRNPPTNLKEKKLFAITPISNNNQINACEIITT